jgi:hypothetical protein
MLHTSVCSQHLAVVSKTMLRLASLLQTDHMLASVFFTQLTRAMKEY